MRCDLVEVEQAADAPVRGRRTRTRPNESATTSMAGQTAFAPNVLDEAFATLADHVARIDRADSGRDLPAAACDALLGRGCPEADNSSVAQLSTARERIQRQRTLVDSLSTQLIALARQREHLVQLLLDIESGKTVDRTDA